MRMDADEGMLREDHTHTREEDLRLGVLGTTGLASGLAASSHFDGLFGVVEKLSEL